MLAKGLVKIATVSALALTLEANAAHRDLWVFGDSLTSPANSWAEVIDDQGYAQIRNTARAGLRLVDVTMPNWLYCWQGEEVVLRLGTNDAGNNVPAAVYEQKLIDVLQFLQGRDCKVWLMLPIRFTGGGQELDQRLRKFKQITRRTGRNYQNVTILDVPYNEKETGDGLHPTAEAQEIAAAWIIEALKLKREI